MLSRWCGVGAGVGTVALLAAVVASAGGQEQRRTITSKGEVRDVLRVHELEWWTEDPLRLDENDDMRFFQLADDGHAYTPRDYLVEQEVTPIGRVAGHRIVEVINTIYYQQRLVFLGVGRNDRPAQWKTLLVETEKDKYTEIYRLQAGDGSFLTMGHATVHGSGSDAILATYDPGNESCAEGYWRFDKAGAHAVDFSPLLKAMEKASPAEGRFAMRCGAMQPGRAEVRASVQRLDEGAEMGNMGEMRARYRIVGGVVVPMRVRFEAE